MNQPSEIKGSAFPPRPKAPAPAETLVHLKAPAPAETLGAHPSLIDGANGTTSTRRLSFADENITHEEPDPEELSDDRVAPDVKPVRKHIVYEKTAGARATRSRKPTIARAMDASHNFRAPGQALVGLGGDVGYAMAALGMSVASSAFALGTTNLFDEIALKQGTLRSAFQAKPSSIDPKNQTEA